MELPFPPARPGDRLTFACVAVCVLALFGLLKE